MLIMKEMRKKFRVYWSIWSKGGKYQHETYFVIIVCKKKKKKKTDFRVSWIRSICTLMFENAKIWRELKEIADNFT